MPYIQIMFRDSVSLELNTDRPFNAISRSFNAFGPNVKFCIMEGEPDFIINLNQILWIKEIK